MRKRPIGREKAIVVKLACGRNRGFYGEKVREHPEPPGCDRRQRLTGELLVDRSDRTAVLVKTVRYLPLSVMGPLVFGSVMV